MTRILLSLLGIAFGVFMILFGGYDDSPGAQGIGVIVVITGIVFLVRSRKKNLN